VFYIPTYLVRCPTWSLGHRRKARLTHCHEMDSSVYIRTQHGPTRMAEYHTCPSTAKSDTSLSKHNVKY